MVAGTLFHNIGLSLNSMGSLWTDDVPVGYAVWNTISAMFTTAYAPFHVPMFA
jgi:hypothetical protein